MPKLHNLFKRKPEFNNDAVVYRIPCNDCNQVYIGQTGQNLSKRIKQHKYTLRNGTISSAISQHFSSLNHDIDFDRTSILSVESDYFSRIIQEAFFINKEENVMANNKPDYLLKLPFT